MRAEEMLIKDDQCKEEDAADCGPELNEELCAEMEAEKTFIIVLGKLLGIGRD